MRPVYAWTFCLFVVSGGCAPAAEPGVSVIQAESKKPASAAKQPRAARADYTITVDARRVVREVPPGVVGWGAMWKRDMLWPAPPKEFANDRQHRAFINHLAVSNRPLIREADLRHISWPWGVSFSTFGVNWENSAKPWSRRVPDCVRGSGWCEKAIVGVGDLLTLADAWELEAVTVAVPLAVFDGNRPRWGPRLFHDDFPDGTIEKISDHAVALIAFMKQHPAWKKLTRVYLSAGCEWRKYKLRAPSGAVLTYAKLIKRIREKIQDKKVWVVASASDGADIPGRERMQAANWNPFLYDQLHEIPGVALDLHRYRGMIGAKPSADNKMPMNAHNIDVLLRTGLSQRGYLTVDPTQWKKSGKPMPTVLLENAIHGRDADHKKQASRPHPWPAVMAHADLVRETLAGESLTFLGWTWFPETLPPEWPHGALRGGKLAPHARAQAFLSHYHRGQVLRASGDPSAAVRGNATRSAKGVVHVYGGNFSRRKHTLRLTIQGHKEKAGTVEILSEKGVKKDKWDGSTPISLDPMTLWRVRY